MFTSTFLVLLVSKLLLDVWSHLAKLGSPVHMLQWAIRAVAHRHTHHITCLIWHVPSGAWRWACAHSSLNWIGCQWPCLKHLITVSDKTKEPRNCCLSLTLQLLVGALCSIDVEKFFFSLPRSSLHPFSGLQLREPLQGKVLNCAVGCWMYSAILLHPFQLFKQHFYLCSVTVQFQCKVKCYLVTPREWISL